MVGIGVGKRWAVSENNRCEREQSLAASTIAEAPVCQTCTTCRQQQASSTASKQARQEEGRSTCRYLTSAGCLCKLTTGEQAIAVLVFHSGKDAGWKSASIRAEANLQALYCWRQKQLAGHSQLPNPTDQPSSTMSLVRQFESLMYDEVAPVLRGLIGQVGLRRPCSLLLAPTVQSLQICIGSDTCRLPTRIFSTMKY